MSECPEEQVLLHYAADRSSPAEREQFEEHLGKCDRCKKALEWVQAHLLGSRNEDDEDGQVTDTPDLSLTGSLVPEDAEGISEDTFDLHLLEPSKHEHALGRLGNHEILEVVGHGGMGVVFRAHDERLRRDVAIKALNRALASSSTARDDVSFAKLGPWRRSIIRMW